MQIDIKEGTPLEMDADDQPTFQEWLNRCDRLFNHYFGVSIYDVPDQTWADWYEERLRPVHAVNRTLEDL